MTMIVHRCTECGHPECFHERPPSCCYTWCHCPAPAYGPPELIPTWGADSEPIERVVPPGTQINGYPPTCDCTPCRELYDRSIA